MLVYENAQFEHLYNWRGFNLNLFSKYVNFVNYCVICIHQQNDREQFADKFTISWDTAPHKTSMYSVVQNIFDYCVN